MEVLALSVAMVALLLTLCFFAFKPRSKVLTRLPPGSFGWPVIGETSEFLFGTPEKFVTNRMKKYSPDMFKTKIFGEKTAVICGPNGHKFLFSTQHKLFNTFLPLPMQKLFLSNHTSIIAPPVQAPTDPVVQGSGFLKPEALIYYLENMESIIQQHLQTHWEGKDEVKVYPLAKTLTLTLACRFFLGIDNPERIVRLVGHFDVVTLGMHSFLVNFPGTAFYYASKAVAVIRKELVDLIREKKAAMEAAAPSVLDVLAHMILATDETGQSMPDVEVADRIMGFLVAGYFTLASTMTFFMKFVGERPDIYNNVLAEQMEVSKAKQQPGELLNWNDRQKMKYSWAVICEVMRLVPPSQGTFREALTDFTYAGYTIPKGWKVFWTVSTTNKNPKYFQDPEKFDPSRYVEGGGGGPSPYTYVPFGGGPRMCPGREYARLALLTFVHNVVKKFKWEVLFPSEKILGDMLPVPEKGVLVRLYPR